MSYELIHSDCLEAMQGMDPDSVDAIVTDPPYELGFMSKSWDSTGVAYRVETWAEALRILKPGGHLLAFGGTRTYHRLACAIEDAGFEIRDTIQWLHGSGFPKSLDVSKQIDKMAGASRDVVGKRTGRAATPRHDIRGGNYMNGSGEHDGSDITAPATEPAKRWEGWGTALKPSHEPIVMARKPLSESSIARNVLEHSTGAINVDGCRVGSDQRVNRGMSSLGVMHDDEWISDKSVKSEVSGRFPANLLLSHHESCQRIGTKRVSGDKRQAKNGKGDYGANFMDDNWKPKAPIKTPAYGDPDGLEEVESWECARDEEGQFICPVALLDQQSGTSKERSRTLKRNGKRQMDGWGLTSECKGVVHGDSGGASRFFQQFHEPDTGPGFYYAPKASRRERTANGTVANGHPTVKNLSLMRYLVRLVTPPDGTVLDCFCGSGTTGIAAIEEGFNFIGIDSEDEYIQIAKARLAHYAQELEKTSEEKLFA